MKRFIFKNLVFSTISIIIVAIVFVIFKYKVEEIKVSDSTNILISGDSHIQSSLDDSIIENSLNISQGGEHFLYSYNVIKLILKNNPQINRVILGVSFHSFSEFYDKCIHDREKTEIMNPKYFQILDLNSVKDTYGIKAKDISSIFKNIVKTIIFNEHSFIGSYYESEGHNLNINTINETIQEHYYIKGVNKQDYSKYQLKYLINIINYCNRRNIKLTLINTPIHKKYYKKIPEKFISNYYFIMSKLKNKVQFHDLHSLEFKDEYYGDGDHLNSKGAKIISKLIHKKNIQNEL